MSGTLSTLRRSLLIVFVLLASVAHSEEPEGCPFDEHPRLWRNTEFDGNSIFVFETTQLCIGPLGHLHHTLTPEHLKKLGQIDVLLVPVDGGYRGRLCV